MINRGKPQPVSITVPFAEGVDDSFDYKMLPQQKLRELENARITKRGALQKRLGFAPLSTGILGGGSISSTVAKIHGLNESLLLSIDNTHDYTWSAASTSWVLNSSASATYPRNRSPDVFFTPTGSSAEFGSSIDEDFGVFPFDALVIGNYRFFAQVSLPASTSGYIHVYVHDINTGGLVDSTLLAIGSNNVRVRWITQGTTAYLVWQGGATLTITSWDTTSPSSGFSTVDTQALNHASDTWEAAYINDTRFVIIHGYGNATSNNVVAYQCTSGTIAAAVTLYAGDSTNTIKDVLDVVVTSDGASDFLVQALFVENGSPGTTYVVGYDAEDDAAEFSVQTILGDEAERATGYASGTDVIWLYHYEHDDTYNATTLWRVDVDITGTIGTAAECVVGGVIGSRASSGRVVLYSADLADPYVTVYDVYEVAGSTHQVPAPTARAYAGTAAVIPVLPDVESGYTAYVRHILPQWITLNSNDTIPILTERTTERWATQYMSIDDTSYQHPKSVQVKDSLVLTGGVPKYFDSNKITPVGFIQPPRFNSISTSTSGGSMSDGTYLVTAVFEYTDALGNVHRSPPTTSQSVTLSGGGSNQKITILFYFYGTITADIYRYSIISGTLTGAASYALGEARVIVYRTLAGGTTFYKYSNGTANSLAVTLTKADADIEDNAILYTAGGELAAIAPPFTNNAIVHRNRVFLDNGDNEVWVSKPLAAGYAPEFSNDDSMILRDDIGLGKITSLASMDGRLLVFAERGVFYREGEPPNAQGVGSMTPPRPIASSVGAIRGSPTAVTSIGCFFVSNRGIELLTRNLTVAPFFGSAVEDKVSGNITSMVNIDTQDEVRFTYDTGDMLVFNYRFGQWCTNPNLNATGATLWNGSYAYVEADGTVNVEDTGFDDNSTSYVFKVRTGWIKPADIQGYFKLWKVALVGTYKSNHTFTVEVYTDYDESTAVVTKTVSVTSSVTPLQTVFKPLIGRVQAVQFVIKDASPSGTEESFSLSHLQLDCGILPGTYRKVGV